MNLARILQKYYPRQRKILKKLTSKGFHGRGYVKNGDGKAADYIAGQFEKHKVSSFEPGYFQPYSFSINTFPTKIMVAVDGLKLIPGKDYVISSSAPSVNGTFPLHFASDTITGEDSFHRYMKAAKPFDSVVVTGGKFRKDYGSPIPGISGVIVLTDKAPGWHVSDGSGVSTIPWLKIKWECACNYPFPVFYESSLIHPGWACVNQ